ncbi:MAG: hypothetical protein AAF639_24060 [Chloroflexota bacterium]
MKITHVSLLQQQRDLYAMPRNRERFDAYLRVIKGDTDDVALPPLIAMNPMGREHLGTRLDELLMLGADEIAKQATLDAHTRLTNIEIANIEIANIEIANIETTNLEPELKHGLVIVDDVHGGWTNRYTTEATAFFNDDNCRKRHWITTMLWVSETPTHDAIRQSVLRSIGRTAHIFQHGLPKTLQSMMRQEGFAAKFAQMTVHLNEDDVTYSREVIAPLLDSTDYGLCLAVMYGDPAANMLGYTPQGLSDRAGFAVALDDALNLSTN